jgi:hypothetical protein
MRNEADERARLDVIDLEVNGSPPSVQGVPAVLRPVAASVSHLVRLGSSVNPHAVGASSHP